MEELCVILDSKIEEETKVITTISPETKKKLLSYQIDHVIKLMDILNHKFVAIDSSDTGVGKTYAASAISKEIGRKPIVICPKTLIHNWKTVLNYFEVEYYDIVNFETAKNGKTYKTSQYKSRKKNPFLEINFDEQIPYQWKLPSDSFVIIDESHKCKDPSTENGKLLLSLKNVIQTKIPVLMLSATICEKITDLKVPFFLFGFISRTKDFNHYCKIIKRRNKRFFLDSDDKNLLTLAINKEIKGFTSRIKIKDLGKQFPQNQWYAQLYVAEESHQIGKMYDEIAYYMEALKKKPEKHHLATIQKLKQEIELRKTPIFIEQAKIYLEEGKSVIIFVNYLNTLKFLAKKLNIKCKIFGEQSLEERIDSIELFQKNDERIIICQMRAGGIGISLHDTDGRYPRATLMNYPNSASDLLQALGRAHRAEAKSAVIQRIICVANVEYEQQIMININSKLTNISAINDGDLNTYRYSIRS